NFLNIEKEQYIDRGLESHLFKNRKKQIFYADKDSFLIKTRNMTAFYDSKEWKQIPKNTGIFNTNYFAELKGDKIFFLDNKILKVLDTRQKTLTTIAKDVINFKAVKDGNEVYFNQNHNLKHAEGF
ncbi:hypothetical protein KY314_01390, partial [Candidatus Woesearchaeota archaeon]|nr:hypothetical protein [Candidatus Woesearchaeota archaeon]